jgi:cephalosporin hydroxylase
VAPSNITRKGLEGELERLAAGTGEPIESRLGGSVGDYWRERVALHMRDSYAGIPMAKFPEDLRLYEHLLWARAPEVVVEIGCQHGASVLWFRDRLRTLAGYGLLARPRVIALDVDTAAARANLDAADPGWGEQITLVEGDVRDPALTARIRALIPEGAECFVVEDSAHEYETTLAALDGFAPLIQPGGFMMVEDGCVDVEAMRLEPDWPRGVLPAIHEWLSSPAGSGFRQRRDLELYGVTCHPAGLLQRVPEPGSGRPGPEQPVSAG